MSLKKINNEYIVVLFSILLGATFLLSTIGKAFDLNTFRKIIVTYGVPYYTGYIVLIIELIFSVCFCLLLYLKQVAKFSIAFIIVLTIVNTIGHYSLNIESCECFGRIYFLNPSSYSIFLLKNLVLILMSFYIFKSRKPVENKIWLKRIIVLAASIAITYLSFEYNEYYTENYSKRNVGLSIKDLNINKGKIRKIDYLFFFSPTCSHCQKAIPKINALKTKYSLNLVGITAKSNNEKIKNSSLEINFSVIIIENNHFMGITKLVPVIFKIKNDTVNKIIDVEDFISENDLKKAL